MDDVERGRVESLAGGRKQDTESGARMCSTHVGERLKNQLSVGKIES